MNTKYRIDLGNGVGPDEITTIAHEIIKWGGTGWYQNMLAHRQIKGRTKMVDAFRWSWGNTSGRTDADRVLATANTLKHITVEELIEAFLIEFPLSRATNCIQSALEAHGYMKYTYTIEVEMS